MPPHLTSLEVYQKNYEKAFKDCTKRLKRCISLKTEYFEGLKNSSDTEAPFLDLNLSITNGIVSSKIYD